MKSVLFFNVEGIVEKRTTNKNTFQLLDYPDFDAVKKYNEYFILYTTLSTDKNKLHIPFTSDTFNGDILIIKVINDKIENLTIKKYMKLITTRGLVFGEEYDLSNSDSDPFDESCNLQGFC